MHQPSKLFWAGAAEGFTEVSEDGETESKYQSCGS